MCNTEVRSRKHLSTRTKHLRRAPVKSQEYQKGVICRMQQVSPQHRPEGNLRPNCTTRDCSSRTSKKETAIGGAFKESTLEKPLGQKLFFLLKAPGDSEDDEAHEHELLEPRSRLLSTRADRAELDAACTSIYCR